MQLTGTFLITDWQESTQKDVSTGAKLNKAVVSQTYSGDIAGNSEVHYYMHYCNNGDAHFTGFEYLTATINNQPCELVLCHKGKFSGGVASSQFTVVTCEAAPDLAGVSGRFSSTESGQAKYTLFDRGQ